jgi:acyl carrier protein
MNREMIRDQIKELICKVTGFEPEEISDVVSFRDDLELDSLALIEIAVEVGYSYGLKLSEKEMMQLQTLDDAVEMVVTKMDEAKAVA